MLCKPSLQDWTGLNFQDIMDEAEKIRVTVCIVRLYLILLHLVTKNLLNVK